jgi:hypothetical protein
MSLKYVHLPVDFGGRVTAAFRHDQDRDFEGQKTITVGLSFCNPSDNFCKATGREIATERFEKGETHTVPLIDGEKVSDSIGMHLMSDANPMMALMGGNPYNSKAISPAWLQEQFIDAMRLLAQMHAQGHQHEHGCEEGCSCE